MPPSLANSVFHPYYDQLIETVETAADNGFDSVQLYVNKVLESQEYRADLIKSIIENGIKSIVIHLPNYSDLNESILNATQELVRLMPRGVRLVGLIHYEDDIPLNFPDLTTKKGNRTRPLLSHDIPKIKGLKVGLENSKIKEFDPKHVMRAYHLAKLDELPFVFDIGRIMYPILKRLE